MADEDQTCSATVQQELADDAIRRLMGPWVQDGDFITFNRETKEIQFRPGARSRTLVEFYSELQDKLCRPSSGQIGLSMCDPNVMHAITRDSMKMVNGWHLGDRAVRYLSGGTIFQIGPDGGEEIWCG